MKKLDFVVEIAAAVIMEVSDDFDASNLVVGVNVPRQLVIDALLDRVMLMRRASDIGEAISIGSVFTEPM